MAAQIISSTYTLDTHPQADGTYYITEIHTWDSGLPPTIITYGPVPLTLDLQAIADARAITIMQSKKELEARDNLFKNRYLLVYNTENEMLVYLRDFYVLTTGMTTCQIARWIIDRLNDSSFTVSAIRTVWGMSPPQWNSFNGVLDAYAAAYTSVTEATGTKVS